MQPTVISTFAGCGGSSLGYTQAGFKELLAIDFNKHAVSTFKRNFPDTPIWLRDISNVDVSEILQACNIKTGELDVLDGSPPCQGFSMAGKRNVNDSRNNLFKEYIRLVEGLRPKIFVMENVPGMAQGKMRGRFIEITKSLKATGYIVKCKLMNSANYGVPQSRRRLIWIGVRADLNIVPSFPVQMKEPVTVLEAFDTIQLNNLTGTSIGSPLLRQRVPFLKQGQCADKICDGKYYNTIRLAWDRPAHTIIKTRNLIHPEEDRYLSINECKRIASFPDNFEFSGSHSTSWAQIGNAVMPRFMQAIAEHVLIEILKR